MLTRLRSRWLAGAGALLLILSLSGIAAAATLVSDATTPVVEPGQPDPGATDTTLTFQDANGNGVDDHCEAVAAPDAAAAAAALAAVDLDADGTISVSEAAQSDWVGGANCNHGGYVSTVAQGAGDACDPADAPAATTDESKDDSNDQGTEASTGTTTVVATVPACTEDAPDAASDTTDPAPGDCPVVVAPVTPTDTQPTVDTGPNAHGKAVSAVAQSDAVGGKNCNHGGAVSEAAKKDHSANGEAARLKHADRSSKRHGKGQGGQN